MRNRRRLIPITLTAGLCWLTTVALAQTSSRSVAPRPSLALNLSGVVDFSDEMPFVDLFQRARQWVPQAEGKGWGQGEPLQTTPEGWVARLEGGQYATTIVSCGGHPAGRYTCQYEGRGTLRLWGDVKDLREEGSGRITFDSTGDESIFIDVRATDPGSPIRDIRVIMPGFEDSHASEPFYPPFMKRTGQFQAIRFMDWMQTNGSEIATWADRPQPTDFSQAIKGVSLEHMIDLSNRLKVDPWFCMPHLADDDYVRQFATQVREELDKGLKVYVEYSNEVWNGQFPQARYALEQGRQGKLSDDDFQAQLFYNSLRSVQIFAIWEQVFGGTDRLVRVLGSQSVNPWVSEQVATFRDAYRHADALAIAPYFGGSLGDPSKAAEVARMSVAEVLAFCREDIERNVKHVANTVALARPLGLDVIAYEAGQHLVGHGGAENNAALEALFHAANRDPAMTRLYLDYMAGWKQAGGQLMAIFSSVAQPSKWGSWGILESERQDPTTAPKYQAVVEFLRTTPAWWTP